MQQILAPGALLRLEETGHIGAVHPVFKGQQTALEIKSELRVGIDEALNESSVFLRLEAARAINQRAAWLHLWGSAGEEFELRGSEPLQFRGLKAPAKIDAPADDARVGTRHVEKDAVEWLGEVGVNGSGRTGKVDDPDSETVAVFADQLTAANVNVLSHDIAAILHALRNVGCLSSGRGT